MNALSKYRLNPKQREEAKRIGHKVFEENRSIMEEKLKDQLIFMFEIAISCVLEENLGFGEVRRKRTLKAIGDKANEIADMLISNTCNEGNEETYDVEYNRELLHRYADRFGIQLDESIFDY